MWWWALACRQVEPIPSGPCRDLVAKHNASDAGVRIASPHCGELFLGEFEVQGEGSFVLDLYADGERLLPKITASGEARVRGLQVRGEHALEGHWPLTAWRLGAGVGDSALGAPGPEVSHGAGLLGRGDGASVLLGAHSAEGSELQIVYGEDEVQVDWVLPERTLQDGEALYLDPLFAALGPDPLALWQEWSARIAPELEPSRPPASGWSVPEELSAGEILQQAPGLGVALVRPDQVDPSDLQALGVLPGLVWSPLLASEAQPDWWARDASGQELVWDGHPVLDLSQDVVLAWLSEEARARAEAGWLYQRLEGLGAATLLGPGSLQLTLQTLREAAPGMRWVGGGDTPLLPSVGGLDGWVLPEGQQGWEALAALSFARGRLAWLEAPALTAHTPDQEVLAALAGGGLWHLTPPEGWPPRLEPAEPGAELRPVDVLAFPVPSVPARWESPPQTALVNLGSAPITVDGPGGVELLSGVEESAGPRTLSPGQVELWDAATP